VKPSLSRLATFALVTAFNLGPTYGWFMRRVGVLVLVGSLLTAAATWAFST